MLTPGYTLTLGSQQWTQGALRIELKLASAPRIDVLTIEFPAAAQFSAGPGDPASLHLASGDAESDVFQGRIDAVHRGFAGIRISCLDAGGVLARYRPAVTYEMITAGTLIRNLCGDAQVDPGTVDDGVELAYYAADPTRTAWEHVARVAAWSGCLARVTESNAVDASVVNATQAEVALKYGRELLTLDQGQWDAPLETFAVAGESGAGSTSAPEALRPSTDFFAGNRPDEPSPSVRWSFEPALRTAKGAATAGAAQGRIYQAARRCGHMSAFLLPRLRPGTVFEVQELPDGLASGPFWVSRAQHVIDERGARTRAWFYGGGDDFDPASLLGALLGALAGAVGF
jgi:hypothetical protein